MESQHVRSRNERVVRYRAQHDATVPMLDEKRTAKNKAKQKEKNIQ